MLRLVGMMLSTIRLDLTDSPPHLLMLCTFLAPRLLQPQVVMNDREWSATLGESNESVSRWFEQEGFIEPANLLTHLSVLLNLEECRRKLVELGLPELGNKSDLVRRLVSADPTVVVSIIGDSKVYQCSTTGMALA